ncbi:PilZ domain-containing protein [Halioglobus maricola]|uniref:PilZ domain-containing protein n=1 Tax=Halioglobus maricola TaxID=2601894 RepID=A0A5P9NKN8_9GAMM|nr:PilZ domain-containing protein [Halioglobus maricola]QFU76433.1 PilZ domain-containing protein [Halioglobus maricola]
MSEAVDYAERREHERVSVVQAIFLEVEAGGGRRQSESKVIRCETVDVSVAGLRILVPESIDAGSTVHIAVPMSDWKNNLELVGEAKWCQDAHGKSGYWVGLELKDTTRENMEKWCKVVHQLGAN